MSLLTPLKNFKEFSTTQVEIQYKHVTPEAISNSRLALEANAIWRDQFRNKPMALLVLASTKHFVYDDVCGADCTKHDFL